MLLRDNIDINFFFKMSLKSSTPFGAKSAAELKEIARKELNEDPNLRDQSIQIIRDWIQQQPHLIVRTDDEFILSFLRACSFSIERTKERIDGFYTMRTALPEWYTNRDPHNNSHVMELLNAGCTCVLPGYDKEGRRVVLVRLALFDPHKTDINAYLKLNKMIADYLTDDIQTQICGLNFVPDVSGITGAHLSCFSPSVVKKNVMIWQEYQPIRILGINICKEPPIFQSLLSVFKIFLNDNLKKLIVLHGKNMKTVHEAIPLEILPVEYGGTAGKMKDIAENFKQEILSRREKFVEEEKYGVDESKRPGKPKTKEDLFGMDGSFRKLNID